MFFANDPLFTSRLRRILPLFLLLFTAVLLLILISPTAAAGRMAYVDAAAGSDTGDCSDPAAPCLTINYAIAQTSMEDMIVIAGGVYVENVKLIDGISRTIVGGYANDEGVWTLAGDEPTVIDGNDADTTIEIRNHTDTIIESVTVTGGKGPDDPTFGNGCGGFKIQNSDVVILQSAISENSAGTGEGGALCAAGDDGKITLDIENSTVEANLAENGGAFSLFNTETFIGNSLIMGNESNSGFANVMLLHHDDDVHMYNSTVFGNNPEGDQAVHVESGILTVRNSIWWNNGLNFHADPPCPACFDVAYSDIEQTTAGTGNISEYPMFRHPAIFDLQLNANSPCIDKGTAADAPPKDIDGTPRDEKPDMGAYEFVPKADGLMVYVDAASGADTDDCTDPAAPCLTINYAVGQTGDDAYIAVAGGDYVENVKLTDGLSRTIRGGYANDAGVWTLEGGDPTVIDGNEADSTVEIRNHTDTIIDKVIVTGGMGPDDPTFGNGCGGFKIQSSDVVILQSVISENSAETGEGGALCAAGDDGKMSLNIEGTIVEDNHAGRAGAFSLFNTKTIIVNSLIMNNESSSGIANVMQLWKDDDVHMINSTVAGNNPTGQQAVHNIDGMLTVINSIWWNNGLNFQADPPCPACFDVSYSDIEQTTAGTGNISADPMFRDPAIFDLQLKADSPCIDAGTAADAPPKDIDGTPRDDKPDMGAYEWVSSGIYLPMVIGK